MCTITWLTKPSGYEIFFNRDEKRTRAAALKPSIFESGGIKAIYPVDPEGSGSWIFCNDRGFSAALLNFNIKLPDNKYKSRGQLITEMTTSTSIQESMDIIKDKNLREYRGFTLCLFPYNEEIGIFRWDGNKLYSMPQKQPIVSSSVRINEVKRSREILLNEMQKKGDNRAETHIKFHRSHLPGKSYLSTCMHREDAKTLSFSRIICSQQKMEFHYIEDSPCKNGKNTILTLPGKLY